MTVPLENLDLCEKMGIILLSSFLLPILIFSRQKLYYYLARLIPLAEANYNLAETGRRERGKSYGYQALSLYTILLTGAATIANLLFNMASDKNGIGRNLGRHRLRRSGLQKMPKEVVTTLMTYCESGTLPRGKDSLSGMASVAMFGNTNQLVGWCGRRTCLMPMPDAIREVMAFLDRIHFYIPGWEMPKMKVDFFTDYYGFVVDYLAEALRELRKHTFTEVLDLHFRWKRSRSTV